MLGGLRTGPQESVVGKEVRINYGRNWEWKAGGKMKEEDWHGSAILARVQAAAYAKSFVEILTGQEDGPEMLLTPSVSFARWERKIGEWVYYIELTWEGGTRKLHQEHSNREMMETSAPKYASVDTGPHWGQRKRIPAGEAA